MKKIIAILLCLMLALSLTACGEAAPEQVITRATEAPAGTVDAAEAVEAPGVNQPYGFLANGILLVPGTAFDASVLGQASSSYEVPSCAIEGMDVVYNYDSFEVTAFNDGTGEVIYSIYLLDPNVTTPEGVALGDDVEAVVAAYGGDYEEDGTSYTYHAGGTNLVIIFQDSTVASIEYRMAQ